MQPVPPGHNETRQEFVERLASSIDLSTFGSGSSLDDLYAEVQCGKSIIQADEHGIVKRYQWSVQVAVRSWTPKKGYCNLVCVNVKETKEQYQLPSRQMSVGEDFVKVAQEIIEADLHLPVSWQEDNLLFAQAPVVFEAETYSEDYPQMQLVNVIYEVRVRVRDPENGYLIGLPNGRTFTVHGEPGVAEQDGDKTIYIWIEDADNEVSEVCSDVKSRRSSTSSLSSHPVSLPISRQISIKSGRGGSLPSFCRDVE
jgi:hypothetical protein